MSDDRLADEIARRLAELPVPEDSEAEAVRRARLAVTEAARPVGRRRAGGPAWWTSRRRRTLIALAIALTVAGAAMAAIESWDSERAPQVPASRLAAERIAADPLLSQLAWITDTRGPDDGPVRIQFLAEQPSLVFPAGVSFEEGFRRLLDSLAHDGTLPPEAHIGPPLPAGKTLRLPSRPRQGIAIDLRSPRGYLTPSGILPVGFAAPAGWSDEEATARIAEARESGLIVPLGAVIDPPDLEPCQVLDPADPSPSCQLSPPLRDRRVGSP
jgi:hypothetical protein